VNKPAVATSAAVVALGALVAWSFWLRWDVLTSSPFPLGIDGYYYPVQVRGLLAHGHLVHPASPLAFWWMAPFALATDPIAGAKLGAALGGALVALPAYGVGARLGGGRGAGFVAAALATCSATSTYLSIEFAKQGIGLTLAVAAVWALLRALEQPSRRRIAVAAGFALATLLAHKLAGALVVIVAVPAVIEEARGRGALRGRRLVYTLGAIVAALGALAVLGLVFPERLASPADLALARGLVTTDLRWDAPVLAGPSLVLGHEPLWAGVVALAAATVLLVQRAERPSGARVVAWIAIALGVVLALPVIDATDPQGLAMRLRVAAFVPLALCGAIFIGVARRWWWIGAIVALALVVVLAQHDRREGRVLAHPALVAASAALADHVPADAVVVASERHVAFMIEWYADAAITLHPESVPYARRVRVLLPLSPASAGFPLGRALAAARRDPVIDPPIDLHPGLRDGFVLVTEPTWEWILTQLPPRSRRHWEAWPTI